MNALKPNLKFNYLYRDAGNYKNFGSVIFSNFQFYSIERLDELVKDSLIDGEFFNHERLNVPHLFFNSHNDDDYNWHKFESIELTNDKATEERSIEDFIENLSCLKT